MLNPPLRYSEVKPSVTEGNLFTYHLNKLLLAGLINKLADGRYELTSLGKSRVDRISLSTLSEPLQPKIVTIIATRNSEGKYLLYHRNREPFRGLVGFPSGKVHLGEKIAEAAAREMQEKAGLTGNFTHRGDIYITVYKNFELVTQALGHVFWCSGPKGKIIGKSRIGQAKWQKIDKTKPHNYIPGFMDTLRLLETSSQKHFFAEFVYQL